MKQTWIKIIFADLLIFTQFLNVGCSSLFNPCTCNSSGNPLARTEISAKVYHKVEGWDGWLCADEISSGKSYWYVESSGLASKTLYQGTCDSYRTPARVYEKPTIDFKKLSSWKKTKSWPSWFCADYLDQRGLSVWRLIDQNDSEAIEYSGDCASWETDSRKTHP